MLGLGLSLTTGGVATPAYVVLAKAFVSRVEADGGTVDSFACLKTDMAYLTSNPDAPAGYTVEWSSATVGSSAEFRINLVGGAGYTYTYAVTDTQATEVTGTGVMGGDIQAVTADLSTLVDGTVTLAVYLTGAGGDGNVVTDTANLVGYTGLLDTYSGAAAAYSLRLLDTSYTGDAIVVRRASDSATQAIGFVNNELDTTSLESFCSGTDGFVTTWYDQSGNGRDITQTTAVYQPKIVSSGSTVLDNGNPTIQFDGNNDYLNYTQTASNLFAVNHSYFTVHNVYGGSSRRFLIETTSATSTVFNPSLGYQTNNTLEVYSGEANNASAFQSSVLTNGLRMATVLKQDVNSLELFVDGILDTSSSASTPVSDITGYNIGTYRFASSRFFEGNIQEFILYDSYESLNRQGIETNINDFYTIY